MLSFSELQPRLRKEKIQGTYFKICALYFKICPTCFLPFRKTGENCKHKTVGFLEAFSGAGMISSK